MAREELEHSKTGSGAEPAPTVVLLYEDAETGLRARQALAKVQEQGAPVSGFGMRFWRCDLLRTVWLREQAAREAATADVIVLSLHGGEQVPGEVRAFFTQWLANRPTLPCALGVLLDGRTALQNRLTAVGIYIESIAEAAGAHTLWGFSEPTPKSSVEREQGRKGSLRALGDSAIGAARPVVQRWGIIE